MSRLEKLVSRPLPRCLRGYPEPQRDRPTFDLSSLSVETRMRMLAEARKLKGDDHPAGEPFVFDLSLLSSEIKQKMLDELRARRDQQGV
jgi:hypothetical protein